MCTSAPKRSIDAGSTLFVYSLYQIGDVLSLHVYLHVVNRLVAVNLIPSALFSVFQLRSLGFNNYQRLKPLTCRTSFMILFLEKNNKSKGPDGYSVNRKLLAGGIAIDLWGV